MKPRPVMSQPPMQRTLPTGPGGPPCCTEVLARPAEPVNVSRGVRAARAGAARDRNSRAVRAGRMGQLLVTRLRRFDTEVPLWATVGGALREFAGGRPAH